MALASLPNELLDIIAAYIIHTPCENTEKLGHRRPCEYCWVSTLRSLRQVCKALSQQESINANLFRHIQLIADSRHNITVDEVKASGVANHVKHMALLPPLYLSMAYDDFLEVFKNSRKWDKDVLRQLSTAGIASGYLQYNTIAVNAAVQLQHSGALLATWTPLLRLFASCQSFRIPKVDYCYVDHDFEVRRPNPWLPRRVNLDARLHEQSCALAALFVPRAIECLAAARCKVKSLSLLHSWFPINNEIWANECRWEDLDLSSLKTLHISPSVPSYAADEQVPYGHHFTHQKFECLQKGVQRLLSLCAPTLKSLCLGPQLHGVDYGLRSERRLPVALPALTTLTLPNCEVSSSWFSRWIAAMPQLRQLEVGSSRHSSLGLADEPTDSWKDIFDTLRNHPSLIHGYLEIDFSATWTLRFDKSNILEDWGVDDRGYNQVQREYWGQKYELFKQALGNPSEFGRLLVEEHERGDDLSRERLGRFYVCGAIDWPGVQGLEKREDD